MTSPTRTDPVADSDTRTWLVPAAVVVVLVVWASAFIAIRALADSVSPGPLALGRLLVGSLALGVVALRHRRPVPRGSALAMVAAYGILWFAGYSVVLNAAEHHLDAGTAAMLVNIAPILVAIGAGVFLHEGFPRPLLAGIAIAFSGVVIIAAGTGDGGNETLGVVLGVVTAVLYAAGVLTQKVALRSVDTLTATWVGCVIGAAVLTPFLPQLVRELAVADASTILAVGYLGLFPTAIGFTLWAYALSRTTAGSLTSTTLAVPAIAVVMSWIVLDETPTAVALAGGALCLLGVAISRRTAAPRLEPATAES